MSGFLVAAGPRVAERCSELVERSRMLHSRGRTNRVTVHAAGELLACFVNNPCADPVAVDDGASVFIHGRLQRERTPGDAGDAAFALARYRAGGIAALSALNGSFVVGISETNGGHFSLIADPIGSIPCYWREDSDDTLIAATECKCLFAGGEVPAISRDGVLNTLLFGRVKFTRAPLFANVATLAPAGGLTRRAARSHAWEQRLSPEPAADGNGTGVSVAEAADTLRTLVRERLRESGRVAISLSGGIDSRMLLGAVDPADRRDILAVSFGMPGNNESAIARQVAGHLGVPYRDIELTPAYFVDHAEHAVSVAEGQDLFVQGYLEYVTERLRREDGVDSFLDGMEVGVSFGGDYLKPEFDSLAPDELPAFLFRRFYIHKDEPGDVFLGETAVTAARLVDGALSQSDHLSSVYDRLDWLYVECYTREVMRLRHRLVRKQVMPLPLTADRRYLELVRRIPARQRQGRAFQLAVLAHLDPRLLDVPYHSTMLPLTVPQERWREGSRAIGSWEALCQDIWRLHRVCVPFNHYYTNFAQWLRAEPVVLEMVQALLLTDECRLTRDFVRAEWLRRIVREHSNGEADHRSSILYSLGMELFLRRNGGPIVA